MKDGLISRQAAIDAMKSISDSICEQQAIDALCELPSAYRFDEWCTECKEYDQERHCCPRFNAVIRTAIEEMEADRKNGHWIDSFGLAQCSVCKTEFFMKYNYCPNCGADMRGERDDNN